MSTRDRVMICVPCLQIGGTEIHTAALARVLVNGGYDVAVCAYFEHDADMIAIIEAQGARAILLTHQRHQRARNLSAMPRLVGALIREMRSFAPHVVHVQYMTPGLAPLIAAHIAGVDHIVSTIHVTANHYGARRWLPSRIATTLSDAFICVSRTAEQSFFGDEAVFSRPQWDAGRRHFTIYNGIDLERIDAILSQDHGQLAQSLRVAGRPVVGILGRLDRYKGHDLLLRAFAGLSDHPKAILLCVGGGTERTQLELLAKELGIAPRVIFTGALPQQQALAHLALMDVVAMPSRPCLEGFGLAAAEAMAMKRPVVASNVDALKEVIGEDGVAGRLVPAEDVPALRHEIDQLLGNQSARQKLGENARQRVESHFSLTRFRDTHLDLYAAVTSQPARRQQANRASWRSTAEATT